MSNEAEKIQDFNRAVNALALELPEAVWIDFHYRYIQFKEAARRDETSTEHLPESPYLSKESYSQLQSLLKEKEEARKDATDSMGKILMERDGEIEQLKVDTANEIAILKHKVEFYKNYAEEFRNLASDYAKTWDDLKSKIIAKL